MTSITDITRESINLGSVPTHTVVRFPDFVDFLGRSADVVDGSQLSDTITVLGDDLYVFGNGGNDTIDASANGAAFLYGGDGSDIFIAGTPVREGSSSALITDFEINSDKIHLSNYSKVFSYQDLIIRDYSAILDGGTLSSAFSETENSIVIQSSKDSSLYIFMFRESGLFNLSSTDFIFAESTTVSEGIDGTAAGEVINGTSGDDERIRGLDGNDTIDAGAGNDFANGNAGADIVSGGEGNDRVLGGKDNDTVNGDAGDDTINGNLGNDVVSGGTGNDDVRGGQGDDILFGNDGDDIIKGNKGNDTLTGGEGADTFYFSGTELGNDIIIDLNINEDKLFFSSNIFAASTDVVAAMSVSGSNVVINTGNTSSVTLNNFSVNSVNLDFLLGQIDIV